MYYIYVLYSKQFNKSYVGITDNLERRLSKHNHGNHPYTKRYIPWYIKYSEIYIDRPSARAREIYLKSASGRRWMKRNIFDS